MWGWIKGGRDQLRERGPSEEECNDKEQWKLDIGRRRKNL